MLHLPLLHPSVASRASPAVPLPCSVRHIDLRHRWQRLPILAAQMAPLGNETLPRAALALARHAVAARVPQLATKTKVPPPQAARFLAPAQAPAASPLAPYALAAANTLSESVSSHAPGTIHTQRSPLARGESWSTAATHPLCATSGSMLPVVAAAPTTTTTFAPDAEI